LPVALGGGSAMDAGKIMWVLYEHPEADFLDRLDDMSEQDFDDQCTGANPRYPQIGEIKQMYLNAYYGEKR
jgi:acetaldehyde dehydrogenase/alcohol dehydrogenase